MFMTLSAFRFVPSDLSMTTLPRHCPQSEMLPAATLPRHYPQSDMLPATTLPRHCPQTEMLPAAYGWPNCGCATWLPRTELLHVTATSHTLVYSLVRSHRQSPCRLTATRLSAALRQKKQTRFHTGVSRSSMHTSEVTVFKTVRCLRYRRQRDRPRGL